MLDDWRAHRSFDRDFGPVVPRVRETIAAADSAEWVLHPPKTGGTTLLASVAATPGWEELRIRSVRRAAGTAGAAPAAFRGRRAVLGIGHATLARVDWWRARTRGVGGDRLRVLMTVRPARARLVSAFTDYWMQVASAEERIARPAEGSADRHQRDQHYLADSALYRDATGRIDGPAWFRSFVTHGSEVPFHLDEIFGGRPDRLRRRLDDGSFLAIPTRRLDDFLAERGITVDRKRTSADRAEPAVLAAVEAAGDVIDAAAVRDAPYDRILADHLDDPDFAPATG